MRTDYNRFQKWKVMRHDAKIRDIVAGRIPAPVEWVIYPSNVCGYQCSHCLVAGTKITTPQGFRNIEELKSGDEVFSATGEHDRVYKTHSRTAETYAIRASGVDHDLVSSDEHPFLVVPSKMARFPSGTMRDSITESPVFLPLKDIRVGDFLVIPKVKHSKDAKFSGIKISPDLGRLIGYFLAEGYAVSGRFPCRHTVNFALHHKETELAQDIASLMLRFFGVKAKITDRKNCLTKVVQFFGKDIYDKFTVFGKGAHEKAMPPEYLFLPAPIQKQILKGFFAGDGHIGKNTNNGAVFVTMSKTLREQLTFMLHRNDIFATFCYSEGKNRGRINLSNHYANKFLGREEFRIVNKKENNKLEGAFLAKILSIKKQEPQIVYNIETLKDHTYIANSVAVHNCIMAREQVDHKNTLSKEAMLKIPKDAVRLGIPCVVFSGGGDPLLNPHTMDAARELKSNGVLVGINNQGFLLNDPTAFNFIRYSVDAASRETYHKIHGVDGWERINANIARHADLRRAGHLIEMGLAFLVTPWNFHEARQFVEWAQQYKPDFIHIRPAFLDSDYMAERYPGGAAALKNEIVPQMMETARQLEAEYPNVYFRIDKFEGFWTPKRYSKCRSTPLMAVTSGDGAFLICQDRGIRKEENYLRWGNYNTQTFDEIWWSKEHEWVIASIDLDKCPRCVEVGYNEIIEHAYINDGLKAALL